RFHADMTERQIAGALGISQSHVSRLLGGALSKLREELGDHEDSELERDIAAPEAISPDGGASATDRKTDPRPQNVHDRVQAENKIEPVPVSAKNPQIARYLSLPYHVMVKSERTEEGSFWSAAVEELPGCEARGAT